MRQGLDIADVEVATKIRAKYLRALENEEFGMLPGSTFAKTFMRTYAEHLGLDPQLLIEEYRAEYEPRGESELPLTPRPARQRERRGGGGPPVGPGTAFAIGVVLLLVLLAVIGLTGGDDGDGGSSATDTTQSDRSPEKREPARRRPAAPRTLRVRVAPVGATYVCIDDGNGKVSFEGTLTGPRTFRSRRRMRINLGRASARLTVNGKRVPIADGPSGAGFSISRGGRATPLPAAERPCA
jgi:hypothetical protein